MQWVWDTLFALRPTRTPGAITSQTTRGISSIPTAKPAPRAAPGVTVKQYRFKSMHVQGDYIVCRTFDNNSEGTTDVLIAKPFKLRFSITGVVIDGSNISYTNYSNANQTRTATTVAGSEIQVIVPRYVVNDLIYGITVDHTGVVVGQVGELKVLDLNADGRAWAKKYI
jgi:hypothetical protein